MPRVVFYKEADGTAPALDWLNGLPDAALEKSLGRVERLKELGHALRRPECDYLRDGIYELRSRYQSVNYRLLYFFFGKVAIVVAHGLTKESEVPSKDIEIAIKRRLTYLSDPAGHTLEITP